jgi:hypothetical protein
MIAFRWQRGPVAPGTLVFDGTGFDTEPRPEVGAASVSIRELELMLTEGDQRVAFVTGYCPHQGWLRGELQPPRHRQAQLFAVLEKPIPLGASVGLHPPDESWPIIVDTKAGWVRLGKGDPREDVEGIEFAPGAVAVLDGDQLKALWPRPVSLPIPVTT